MSKPAVVSICWKALTTLITNADDAKHSWKLFLKRGVSITYNFVAEYLYYNIVDMDNTPTSIMKELIEKVATVEQLDYLLLLDKIPD